MIVRDKQHAESQAIANAKLTGTPWVYGTDTSGNWHAEAVGRKIVNGWTVVYPDGELAGAAATLGRAGGQSTSEAKKRASRENGKLGGRPKST